ncbi:MAG: CBS domain-containing protein [Gammaproteobacteria bacterium]
MSKVYEAIAPITLQDETILKHKKAMPELVHIDDPATSILLTLEHTTPLTISPNDTIPEALMEMKANNEHLLFVIDEDQKFSGIISSEVIHSERPYQIIEERRITYNELLVRMLMVRREKVLCLNFEDIKHAKIGHIIETFKQAKRRYALVLNVEENGEQCLHGYFSATQI